MSTTNYPVGRSAYRPAAARVGDPTPQSHPDLFSTEDLRAEINYLKALDRRYGLQMLRVSARARLIDEIIRRKQAAK